MTRPLQSQLDALIRDVPDYPQPGIVFKDITPILADPSAFAAVIDAIADAYADVAIDKIAGIEARGFILAAPAAYRVQAGFVPVRKRGKLPGSTYRIAYDLEYGAAELEVHDDAFAPGERVLIVDDVLATGGTAEATSRLIEQAGASVIGVCVLLELSFLPGRERLAERGLDVRTLLVS